MLSLLLLLLLDTGKVTQLNLPRQERINTFLTAAGLIKRSVVTASCDVRVYEYVHTQQQRIKRFRHFTRLPIQHPAQRTHNTRFSGPKARGRPQKIWINGVKETLSLYNIPPAQAFRRAADKRLFLPATPQVV